MCLCVCLCVCLRVCVSVHASRPARGGWGVGGGGGGQCASETFASEDVSGRRSIWFYLLCTGCIHTGICFTLYRTSRSSKLHTVQRGKPYDCIPGGAKALNCMLQEPRSKMCARRLRRKRLALALHHNEVIRTSLFVIFKAKSQKGSHFIVHT